MDIIAESGKLIRATLEFILERSDRLIDTKVNIITGRDFTGEPEAFKQADIIYSWIQGRGLESLAGHAGYFAGDPELPGRIKTLALSTLTFMEKIRSRNHGRMFFCFNQQGEPLEVTETGMLRPLESIPSPSNYSDLFYAKGLLSAAAYYRLDEVMASAEAYFKRTIDDIGNENFLSDQQAFDPKNPVRPVPGKFIQGPRMIALSGLSAAYDITGKLEYLHRAHEFISHILRYHVNCAGDARFEAYDFWEAVDENGQPWRDGDMVLSDPGHALEFVGLSLKCLLRMLECGDAGLAAFAASCRDFYPDLMKRSFNNGVNREAGGICKAFDLVSRRPVNSDMPWWSLPETMRAAALMQKFCGPDRQIPEMLEFCAEAFFKKYVNPKAGNLQYQTRAADGSVVNAIPAVPDADPGYHTNLSLIDMIEQLSH